MTIPLVLSVATIVFSTIFQPNQSDSSSSSRAVTSTSTTMGTSHFTYGLVLGMGLSWMLANEMRKRRLLENIRMSFINFLSTSNDSDGEEDEGNTSYSKPVNIANLAKQESENMEDGVRRTLVSQYSALTSNLNVVILTIPKEKEIVMEKSTGVEFYYVLRGSGMYLQQDSSTEINEGDGFVVDFGRDRGFACRVLSEMTLLCATDEDPVTVEMKEFDGTTLDERLQSATMSMISAGFSALGGMVKR